MKHTLIAVAALVVTTTALAPLSALAAEGVKPAAATSSQSASFDTLDVNKDGRVSMPEASADAKLVEGFATADKNGDGYLDNAEFDDRADPRE